MESLYDWAQLYQTHASKLEEIRMSFYHGISLLGTFILFILLFTRSLQTKEQLKAAIEGRGKPTPGEQQDNPWFSTTEFFFFTRQFAFHYLCVFLGILWVSLTLTLSSTWLPTNIATYVVIAMFALPVVLLYFSLEKIESRLTPDEDALLAFLDAPSEDRPKLKGIKRFKKPSSGLLPLAASFFFGFMIINAGILALSTLTISGLWDLPYAARGKVVSSRTGERSSRYLTLEIEEARFLSASGLGKKVMLPKRKEFRTSEEIYRKVKRGNSIILLVTTDQADVYLPSQ